MADHQIKGWNHVPDVPLEISPLFTLPLRPRAMLEWIWNSWFLITERLILVGIVFLSFYWFQPPLDVMETFAFGWIFELYARNFALMVLVAGGLHLWFYTFTAQGQRLKYDPRPQMKNGKQFTFGGQVRDNMFWTLASGVTVWTSYEILVFWAMANGYAPVLSWSDSPLWFIALFLLIPVWESFYFYWIHRLLHVPVLYKYVHSLHHRNTNVGPWSGLSMHPVEHVIYLGAVLIFLIAPAHPIHIMFLMQYLTLTAATTHCGFEGMVVKDKNRLRLGTFHHQMHHRYFECNYGSLEAPWDKYFGSFHDGTADADARIRERRKRMNA
ncbi:MAG: sterol desaturase family protein [Boseongicola sp.]